MPRPDRRLRPDRRVRPALDVLPSRLAPSSGIPMAEPRPLPPDDADLPGQDPTFEVTWGPLAPCDPAVPAPIAPEAIDPRDGMTLVPE